MRRRRATRTRHEQRDQHKSEGPSSERRAHARHVPIFPRRRPHRQQNAERGLWVRYNDAVLTCASCQGSAPPDARYCSRCGAPLSQTSDAPRPHDAGERRFCTVLFCDLVDSSTLSEDLGAEDYRTLIGAMHDCSATIVERFGGQVLQYLGDGVLVLFGYPNAHEDDAARAVQAAVEAQAAILKCGTHVRLRGGPYGGLLHTRAAIHTGLVVIGELGVGRQRPVLAHGDTVNVAARLQQLAPVDALLVTGATRRLLGDRFTLGPLEHHPLRGIKLPIDAFRVMGARAPTSSDDATRPPALTGFVGRVDELAQLQEGWQRTCSGQGQTVVVSGEPGIGKSRLVAAFRQRVADDARWLEVHGSPFHGASALRPFLQLIEDRVLRGAAGAHARRRLERALQDAGLAVDESADLIASRLSLHGPAQLSTTTLLLPDEQRRRLLKALAAWIWHVATLGPVVLACEDLQWFDPTSLELLRTLATSGQPRRLLLVLTCRAPFSPPWPEAPLERRFVLQALTSSESEELVRAVAAEHAPSAAVMQEVLAKSDGVPLFLAEVSRMLADVPGGVHAVPDNLRALLSARLDRVPGPTQATVRLASVIGRYCPLDLLRAVSQRQADVVDRDIDQLVEAGIMVREGERCAFRHALIRDAAYDRMLQATRLELHGRVAQILNEQFSQLAEAQPELVAYHLTEGGAVLEARGAWERAGSRCLGHGAYVEAAHHFERALTLHATLRVGSAVDRRDHVQHALRLRRDLGVSLVATQGYSSPAVAENYERALTLSQALNDLADEIPIPVLYGLWGTYLVRGDRAATAEFARHFERAKTSSNPLARHVGYSALAAHAFYGGRFADAMVLCQEAMKLYEPTRHFTLMKDYGYEGGLYSHSYAACLLCFTGRPDAGLELINETVAIATGIGDPYGRAIALGFAACVARERRDTAGVRLHTESLLTLASDHQLYLWLGIAHCLRGWSTLADGDAAAGEEEIRQGLAIWQATGARLPGTYLRRDLIQAQCMRGALEAGLAEVEAGLEQCRNSLESYQEPEYHRLKGELLWRKPDHPAAAAEMRLALEGARVQGATWVELRAAVSLARLESGGPCEAASLARLADVTSRITEGLDTPDMLSARTLLGVPASMASRSLDDPAG